MSMPTTPIFVVLILISLIVIGLIVMIVGRGRKNRQGGQQKDVNPTELESAGGQGEQQKDINPIELRSAEAMMQAVKRGENRGMASDEKYPLALPQGTILAGQYVIERTLGQGGFGITYQATDHKTGQSVAVKEFFPDSLASRTTQTTVTAFPGERGESFVYGKVCFLQEAETLAEFIGNENIVRVYSYFEENGTAYFVMEFIEGTSFDQYIKTQGGKVSYEEAEKILLPIIDALAVVHAKGIVHRDVTPDNIYITKDGKVKLLDFGAARYSLGDKSRSLDVVLKHGFAPREQYTRHGRQGPYTDVYTVGASFYFAITGRRPPDSIDRIDEDELIPPSSLGVKIASGKEDAILTAMSVQPSNRYQTMGEFRQALMGQSMNTHKEKVSEEGNAL